MQHDPVSDFPSDQPSAIDILSLDLERSRFDTMSLASSDTNEDVHADSTDDCGVALGSSQPSDHMGSRTRYREQLSSANPDVAAVNRNTVNSTTSAAPTVVDLTMDETDIDELIQSCATPLVKTEVSQLDFASALHNMGSYKGQASEEMEDYMNAPIFSSEVGAFLEREVDQGSDVTPFVQFGLVGARSEPLSSIETDTASDNNPADTREHLMLANMNVPWSAFICGSQGAGKSHTLSCLLENSLIVNKSINRLPNPLTAMVFHYDSYTDLSCTQICEAAYLCSSGIPVTVLVSPSNIWAMSELYANLPGLPRGSPRPRVLPLYLSEKQLNINMMLKLMAVDSDADTMPLYMEVVMSILREMAMEGKGTGGFSYAEFRSRVAAVKWAPGQTGPLEMRLQLLDSFLEPTQFTKTTRPARADQDIWDFRPGTLTIVDLSDPFVNSTDACALFSISLSLFLKDRAKCGRVVALDEAHKFLTQSGAAKALTSDLTSVIRQQRHTGTRVLIATQEPTLSPDLIDLCNATFVHRFLSPAWYTVLREHLAGANKNDSSRGRSSLFETILALQTGEALLFCPTALTSVVATPSGGLALEQLGHGCLKIKIRKRVTTDGGRSILASQTTDTHAPENIILIPMHVVAKPSTRAPTGNDLRTRDSGYSSPDLVSMPRMPTQNTAPMAAVPQPSVATSTVTHSAQSAATAKTKLPEWQERLEAQTRSIIRRNHAYLRWRSPSDIHWGDLIHAVEQALGLRASELTRLENKAPFQKMKVYAREELAKCNLTNTTRPAAR